MPSYMYNTPKYSTTQSKRMEEKGNPEYPPPLLPMHTIPLPPLSNVPISINPLLQHYPWGSQIVFDVFSSPFSALLARDINAPNPARDWLTHPAMHPSTIGSMTIRVEGLPKPIVVFPSRLNSRVVTIYDVLLAVHTALREAVRNSQHGFYWKQNQSSAFIPPANQALTTQHLLSNRCTIDEGMEWRGLCASLAEPDVWDLYIGPCTPL